MCALQRVIHILELMTRNGHDPFLIDATDGHETIHDTSRGFYASSSFYEWHLDKPSKPTEATRVALYALVEPATFKRAIESLGRDLSELELTQHQIMVFLDQNAEWLKSLKRPIFFLMEKNGGYYIVYASFQRSRSIYMTPFTLDYHFVLAPNDGDLFVVPTS